MSHKFSMRNIKPQLIRTGGSRTDATSVNFPLLKDMAISELKLNPQSEREPHWHPNANELGFIIEGEALFTVFSPNHTHDKFIAGPEDLIFIPKGSIHSIENIGKSPLRMLLCFNSSLPEDVNLSEGVKVMPPKVLASVFKQSSDFFKDLNYPSQQSVFIDQRSATSAINPSLETNRLKLSLKEVRPQLENEGGWVKMSNTSLLPALETLAMYYLLLDKNGIREPHWHPNAHELNYLIEGAATITLLSPDGKEDTFDMGPGDISFMPQGYLHHIQNISPGPTKYAVYFLNENPSDIGLSGVMGAFSNETLSSLFKVPLNYFVNFPKLQEDLLIVGGG